MKTLFLTHVHITRHDVHSHLTLLLQVKMLLIGTEEYLLFNIFTSRQRDKCNHS